MTFLIGIVDCRLASWTKSNLAYVNRPQICSRNCGTKFERSAYTSLSTPETSGRQWFSMLLALITNYRNGPVRLPSAHPCFGPHQSLLFAIKRQA